MAELSKCRLCGCSPVRSGGGVWHEINDCPVDGENEFTESQWQTLMGQGEAVGYVNDYQLDCIESKKTIVLSATQNDHFNTELYTQAPAVDGAVLRDAARYRWLRNPGTDVSLVLDKVVGGTPIDEFGCGGYLNYEYRAGDELDEAIDAAMKGEG